MMVVEMMWRELVAGDGGEKAIVEINSADPVAVVVVGDGPSFLFRGCLISPPEIADDVTDV